jgi:hypothetical protein
MGGHGVLQKSLDSPTEKEKKKGNKGQPPLPFFCKFSPNSKGNVQTNSPKTEFPL